MRFEVFKAAVGAAVLHGWLIVSVSPRRVVFRDDEGVEHAVVNWPLQKYEKVA
jgi:hypothetical protein